MVSHDHVEQLNTRRQRELADQAAKADKDSTARQMGFTDDLAKKRAEEAKASAEKQA